MKFSSVERFLPSIPVTEFILVKRVGHRTVPEPRFPHIFLHVFFVHAEADVLAWLEMNGTIDVDYRLPLNPTDNQIDQIHTTDDFALAFKFRWC